MMSQPFEEESTPSPRAAGSCLLVYDIADPRRLHKVAVTCENYGIRIQKSVFMFCLDHTATDSLWKDVCELLDPEVDAAALFPLCAACVDKRRLAGQMTVDAGEDCFIL